MRACDERCWRSACSWLAPGACSGSRRRPRRRPPPAAPADGATEAATVDRILAGLDGVMGDLQRILVRERRITPEVTDRLQAIYAGPELLNQIDAFRADVANGLAGFKDPPGNRVTTVSRLITVSPICVFAEVTRDYCAAHRRRRPPGRRRSTWSWSTKDGGRRPPPAEPHAVDDALRRRAGRRLSAGGRLPLKGGDAGAAASSTAPA